MEILIRDIDIEKDIKGILETHGADEHWGSERSCYLSQKVRLENGFFIQVAVYNGKAAGHAEWIISHESGKKFLYLGMMQIHESFRKRGIGTKLIESGIEYAKANSCGFIRTMPGIESGSIIFYQKNGFTKTDDESSVLSLKTISESIEKAVEINGIPYESIKNLRFTAGIYQHSSEHMWNVFNARSESDERKVFSYKIGEAYVNIGSFGASERGSVLCWCENFDCINEILAIGGSLGYKYLNFCVLSKDIPLFKKYEYEISDDHDVFMELTI